MTDFARVAVLDLRSVAPYRWQLVFAPLLVIAIMFDRPEVMVPGLVVLCASTTAGYPFMVSDRSDLDTLYAVLPLTRRSLLLGHYLWALIVFAVTAIVGTPVSLILAREQHISFTGHSLATVTALSWAAYALSVSIQFPLFVRYGFTRTGLLATTLPIGVVAVAVTRLHLHLTSGAAVLVPAAVGGAALLALSVTATTAIDPDRAPGPRGAEAEPRFS